MWKEGRHQENKTLGFRWHPSTVSQTCWIWNWGQSCNNITQQQWPHTHTKSSLALISTCSMCPSKYKAHINLLITIIIRKVTLPFWLHWCNCCWRVELVKGFVVLTIFTNANRFNEFQSINRYNTQLQSANALVIKFSSKQQALFLLNTVFAFFLVSIEWYFFPFFHLLFNCFYFTFSFQKIFFF